MTHCLLRDLIPAPLGLAEEACGGLCIAVAYYMFIGNFESAN